MNDWFATLYQFPLKPRAYLVNHSPQIGVVPFFPHGDHSQRDEEKAAKYQTQAWSPAGSQGPFHRAADVVPAGLEGGGGFLPAQVPGPGGEEWCGW